MKKAYALLVACIVVGFTLFAIYGNSRKSREAEAERTENLSSWMTFQGMASSYDLSALSATDGKGTDVPIPEVATREKSIGIYISRAQCSSCWEEALRSITAIADTVKGMAKPFILAEGFNRRDIAIMKKDGRLCGLQTYSIEQGANEALTYLSTAGRTFMFTLTPHGGMTNVIFYDKAIAPYLGSFFAKTAIRRDTMNNGAGTAGLDIANPIIHLGKIPPRRKFTLVYRLGNNSGKECVIESMKASCDCISAPQYPKSIKAGGFAEVRVTYLSTGLGDFMREVEVKTNLREKPYVLEFDGEISSDD